MAVDQKIEFFTYELFNRLWLKMNFISKPLTYKGESETSVESEWNADIVSSVQVRMALFSDLYKRIITSKYWYFRHSTADFYAFLIKYFPNKNYPYKSVMDKILALCAFVAYMCGYSHSQGNDFFIDKSYLFCAMYIDQELKTQFYEESGWVGLNRICQPYIAIYDFCMEHSYSSDPQSGGKFSALTAKDIIRSINKFRQFSKNAPSFATEETAYWVYYCLDDMYFPYPQSTTESENKRLSVGDLETLLTDLKLYCNPVASSAMEFDKACKLAREKGWDAKLFLNEFFKNRVEIREPEPIEEFLFLGPFIHLVQTDSSSQSQSVHQSCNFGVGDAETHSQSLVTLSTMDDMDNCIILDNNLNELDEYSEQDYDSYSCHVADISTSGSSLDGSYNVTIGCSAETSTIEKENSSNIQNLIPKLSPEGTCRGSPITSKAHEAEKDAIIDNFSKFDISSLSSDGIKMSPSYDGDSMVIKNRKSTRKENSPKIQNSERKFSSEFRGFQRNPKASENNKDTEQVTGFVPNFRTNSSSTDGIKISPNYDRSSNLMHEGHLDGKKMSSNIQVLETKSPKRTTTVSSSTPQSSETKKNQDQVIGMLSDLDINSFSPDGIAISPNYVRNSGTKKRRSGGKENKQSAKQKPSPSRMLFSSQSTPPSTTVLKSDECKVTDEVSSNDNSTGFYPHCQDSSPNVSRASQVEKEAVAPKVIENKSKPSPVELSHNLTQCSFASKEHINPEKVFDYISETDIYDDPYLNPSNIAFLQETVRQKVAEVEELRKKIQAETSQAQPRHEDPSAPKPSAKKNKKKSKKTKKTGRKTRREYLDETEEYAQDVLRMTLVMGNETALMEMKPTLKYCKEKRKSIGL